LSERGDGRPALRSDGEAVAEPGQGARVVPFLGSAGGPRPSQPAARQPKYAQIANAILARIEAGDWRPGDRLPAETELARSMGASLGTIQRALSTLAETGVLARQHGRGTFVGGGRAPADDLRHFRFLSESGDAILPVYSRMLAIERVEEAGPWARFLGIQPHFLRLHRVLNVAGEFDIASEIYLPGPRFAALAGLEPSSLDGVLIRDFLATRCNAPTLEVEQQLTIAVLPPRACNLIKLPRGSLGLVWLIMGRSYRGQPITWQRAFVPPVDRALQIQDQHAKKANDTGA
jgi:DNA-binding GntR family transcriptional regulator